MKNNYIIFSKDGAPFRVRADNAKLAVCDYAKHCGCSIDISLLARVQEVMTLEELINFFNSQGRLNYNDGISEIISHYITVYPEEVYPTEKGGVQE